MLRSHEPSVVADLSAGLELAESPLLATTDGGVVVEEDTDGMEGERTKAVSGGSAGNGALLVHGPPGVGKTRLVRENRKGGDSTCTTKSWSEFRALCFDSRAKKS